MDQKIYLRSNCFAFLLLLVLSFIDGSVSFISHSFSFLTESKVLWLGALAGLTVLTFEMRVNFLWVTIIVGLIEDIFYSGIIGFYLISFALTSVFLRWISRYLPKNFIYVLSSYFLSITVFSTINYLLNSYLGLIKVMPLQFMSLYLPMTLFTNLIYFVILYIPMIKIIEYFKKKLEFKHEE